MFPDYILTLGLESIIRAGKIGFKGSGWLKNNGAILGEGICGADRFGLQGHTVCLPRIRAVVSLRLQALLLTPAPS